MQETNAARLTSISLFVRLLQSKYSSQRWFVGRRMQTNFQPRNDRYESSPNVDFFRNR